MIMSTEFQLYQFPHQNRDSDDSEESKPIELDQSIIRQVDRGYRYFWARRGRKPPSVSSHYIMPLEELAED